MIVTNDHTARQTEEALAFVRQKVDGIIIDLVPHSQPDCVMGPSITEQMKTSETTVGCL